MHKFEQDFAAHYILFENKISIFANLTSYGLQSFVELDGKYFVIGGEPINIETAINFWQEHFNTIISSEDLLKILVDNNLTSLGI